ncbi:MAG: HAMP domain-containing histidine kinase [Nitrosarchaeum sp.]|nr:MAG: HAMP domain-containing histidine kinase [Nitrosarchaeum sp.]
MQLPSSKLSQIISCVSICIGLIVCIGWILDIPSLKSIIPNEVTMKFSTSISFIFSGVTIYFISRYNEGKTGIAQIVVPISGFIVFLFMATLLTAYIFGITSGIEQLFVRENPDAVKTSHAGMPSFPTIVNFILIIVAGLFAFSESRLKWVTPIGYVISTIGIIAIVGYVVNQPALYYYIDNVNTAMAIHTSILFVILGIALILSRNNITVQHSESVKIYTKITSLFLASSLIPIMFVVGLNFNILEDFPNSESVKISMIIISIVTTISVVLFSLLISKSISKPIISLKDVAIQISKGNFSIKANESGNDEIGELSKTFNQMVNSVIKSERLSTMGLLSSTLGHNIRNDLNVIKMALEILKHKNSIKSDENTLSKITVMESSVLHIQNQIDDTLNFIRQTPLKLEKISLSKLLENTLKTIKIPENIKIDLPLNDISLYCDSSKLIVVLTNLINNSIQAIETEGKISIKAREDQDHSIIQIEDSGSGIPSEIIVKIFEPLFTTKIKGTGLGLASCKHIVEEHNGSITMQNNPTTFTIELPKT